MPAPTHSRIRPVQDGAALQFRVRVMHKGEIALGPGKTELLNAIRGHGSIMQAAKSLGMSYMRAWTLVKVMNSSFRGPLIELERGGAKGGAARLTPLGQDVLDLYSQLIKCSRAATKGYWLKLQKLLRQ